MYVQFTCIINKKTTDYRADRYTESQKILRKPMTVYTDLVFS